MTTTNIQQKTCNYKRAWNKQLSFLPWAPVKLESQNIKKAVIAYLQTIPWTYYLTGSTRYELTLKSIRRLFERWFDGYFTENHQTGMRYWHPGIKTEGSILFWVAEKFEVKDGYHGHGLLYIPDDLPNTTLFPKTKPDYFPALINQWQRVTGNPDRERAKWNALNLKHYDKKRGAGGYCAKYVFKDDADYDLLT